MPKKRRSVKDVVDKVRNNGSWYQKLDDLDKVWINQIVEEVSYDPEISHYALADIIKEELGVSVSRERVARTLKEKAKSCQSERSRQK